MTLKQLFEKLNGMNERKTFNMKCWGIQWRRKSSLVVAVEALVSLCVLQLFLWLHHGDTAVEEPQRDFDSVGFKIVLYSVEIKLTFLGLFPPTLCGLEEIPNTAERFLYSITVMMVQYEGLNCCLLWPTSLCFTGNLFLYAFYDLNH